MSLPDKPSRFGKQSLFALTIVLFGGVAGHVGVAAAASCESLKSLVLPQTTITSAQLVAPGGFTPPAPQRGRAAGASPFADLLAFCRVTGTVARPGDTDVKIEIWMPAQGWNGDFQPAASGFGGGTISYGSREGGMIEFLRRGAATGATNRGHDSGSSPRWKSSDVSSAAYHLMVDRGKKIVAAFYGTAPKFTLMNECGVPAAVMLCNSYRTGRETST